MEKFQNPNKLPREMEFYTWEEFKQFLSVIDEFNEYLAYLSSFTQVRDLDGNLTRLLANISTSFKTKFIPYFKWELKKYPKAEYPQREKQQVNVFDIREDSIEDDSGFLTTKISVFLALSERSMKRLRCSFNIFAP